MTTFLAKMYQKLVVLENDLAPVKKNKRIVRLVGKHIPQEILKPNGVHHK